jgi:hypothetical protein
MKLSLPLCALLLVSGCVSIEVPGLVSDTARVTKDAYKAMVGKPAEPAAQAASSPAPLRAVLSHAYVGTDTQSMADTKQACVSEASQKLNQVSGKAVNYTVLESDISIINGRPVANCKLTIRD